MEPRPGWPPEGAPLPDAALMAGALGVLAVVREGLQSRIAATSLAVCSIELAAQLIKEASLLAQGHAEANESAGMTHVGTWKGVWAR